MAQANITDLFGILPEMAVGGATPQQIMDIIIGEPVPEPDPFSMAHDPTGLIPGISPQEATQLAIANHNANPVEIKRDQNAAEALMAQLAVHDIYNALGDDTDTRKNAEQMAKEIGNTTGELSEEAILEAINQHEADKAAAAAGYDYDPNFLLSSIEQYPPQSTITPDLLIQPDIAPETLYPGFTATADLDQFPVQSTLLTSNDPLIESLLDTDAALGPDLYDPTGPGDIETAGSVLEAEKHKTAIEKEREIEANIEVLRSQMEGEGTRIGTRFGSIGIEGKFNLGGPFGRDITLDLGESIDNVKAIEMLNQILADSEGTDYEDITAIDILNAWDKGDTILSRDDDEPDLPPTVTDATATATTATADTATADAAVEKIIKEFQDWEYLNTSVEEIFTEIQTRLDALGDQYKNSSYFEIPLSDIMKGWVPTYQKTSVTKNIETANKEAAASGITYASLIQANPAVQLNLTQIEKLTPFAHSVDSKLEGIGRISLFLDEDDNKVYASNDNTNFYSLGTASLKTEGGTALLTIGGEGSGLTWAANIEDGELTTNSYWQAVSPGTGSILKTPGWSDNLTGDQSSTYWSDNPQELWEAARVHQMGDDAHKPQFWKTRMHGFTNKWGNYLISGNQGFDSFYNFLKTPLDNTELAKNWGRAIEASRYMGEDLRGRLTGTDWVIGKKIQDGLAGGKGNVLAMAMAGLGVNPDTYGGGALYSRLADMYDIFEAKARAEGKTGGGFLAFIDDQMNAAQIPSVVPEEVEREVEPIEPIGP